jgi:hypothetical protein
MTYATVADLVADARILLQDTIVEYRFSDADLLRALNKGLLEMKRLRPDLFIARSVPNYTAVNTTEVDVEDVYLVALTDYMVGQVQLRDDEETTDERATMFINKFIGRLSVVPS